MKARFDLRLTNQQKGAFNSHPRVEIEYSTGLFIFLPLNEKRKRSCFLIFLLSILNKKRMDEWYTDYTWTVHIHFGFIWFWEKKHALLVLNLHLPYAMWTMCAVQCSYMNKILNYIWRVHLQKPITPLLFSEIIFFLLRIPSNINQTAVGLFWFK